MSDTALRFLYGARVQRVDIPEPGLLCLTLYAGARRHLLLRFEGGALPALASERPRGAQAGGLAQKLRKQLIGRRLVGARWRGERTDRPAALELDLAPPEASRREVPSEPEPEAGVGARTSRLCVWLAPGAGLLVLFDAAARAILTSDTSRLRALGGQLGRPLSLPTFAPEPPFSDDEHSWREQGVGLLQRAAGDAQDRRQLGLEKALRKQIRALQRRREAICGDLARADAAESLRADADWLLCHLDRVPRGARTWELPPRPGEDEPRWLSLDPARSALENAQRWFQQARRHARGRPIATARLSETDAELARLFALRDALHAPDADLEALAAQLPRAAAPPTARGGSTRRSPRLPYRRYLSESDHAILVGRSAADNDTLTLRHARPHDLWLHVREGAGSHVIVPLSRGTDCPDRVRLDAALLAAHHSTARREDRVDVVFSERRHVRKRRGSPPGTVELGRERVLHLRRDEARLRWLLERESR